MFIVNARMSGRMCMNMLYYAQMLPDRQNTKLLLTVLPDAARPCGFIAFSEAGSCELPAFFAHLRGIRRNFLEGSSALFYNIFI